MYTTYLIFEDITANHHEAQQLLDQTKSAWPLTLLNLFLVTHPELLQHGYFVFLEYCLLENFSLKLSQKQDPAIFNIAVAFEGPIFTATRCNVLSLPYSHIPLHGPFSLNQY
ncbi:CPI_1c_G0016550.mRNA.1.CDS.1 [Saccharomyces cerevisiae]|nr:CPI_1c_G0016550.mRNA.1.CDS.1 [Saccharomyces cerevisiae]CAI7272756.1 CPI_1c_G0016550.mRNA.1.CDS.1 [Saccharomyces cerevisiae]